MTTIYGIIHGRVTEYDKEHGMEAKYKRVLLKISGEALAGEDRFGISEEMLKKVALQVKEITSMGVQVAIVVGGGNFWSRSYFHNHFWFFRKKHWHNTRNAKENSAKSYKTEK